VIAVTATDPDDAIFSGANRGDHIAVAAPGVDILAPAPDGTYQFTTGTSVAAAEVSGVVALLIERNPGLTPADVRRILMATAKDLGPKGRDRDFGAGLVNALQAVTAAKPVMTSQKPAVTPLRPTVTRLPARLMEPSTLPSIYKDSEPETSPLITRLLPMVACSPVAAPPCVAGAAVRDASKVGVVGVAGRAGSLLGVGELPG